MRVIGFAQGRIVCKALVAESIEVGRISNAVLDYEPCHGTPAGLSPDSLNLQIVSLADIEQRLDNSNLLADTLPVEKVLEFFCSKMNQNAIISFHGIDENVGQTTFPEIF